MSIPREFIDLLLSRIDLVDLINAQIPLRKKSGSNYFACCPFHQEKSASFSVSQPKQFYYCFSCGAHGNAIDFMIQHDHLNFPEAVEALARQVGMEVPSSGAPSSKNESLSELYDLTARAAHDYYEQMRQSERAIHYLKQRGISGTIAQQFMLGYAPSGWSHLLDTFGKTDPDKKKLLNCGLIIPKNEGGYYDRFRERVMFPIHDYRGRIIGFGGRVLDQGEPKYLNSPETPLFQKGHELYGLHQALKQHRQLARVIIVEGYMDVIALFQHGITYAVATLGTATSSHHLQRLFRYTAEIVFCFDGDNAGRTAAWRALLVTLPAMHDQLQIRFLFLPDGEDPDTLIRKEGRALFEKRMTSALSLSAFFFQTLSQQCDMSTVEGRARLAALALTHLKQLPAEIFQGMMLEELGKRARVDVQTLKQQLHPLNKPLTTEPAAVPVTASTPLPPPIRLALALLIQHPMLAQSIETTLPHNKLPGYDFLLALIDIIKSSPNPVTTGALIEHWRGQKEEPLLKKLAHAEHNIPETGIKNEFLGVIRQLIALSIDAEINHLLSKSAEDKLSPQEKRDLSVWISKKKALVY